MDPQLPPLLRCSSGLSIVEEIWYVPASSWQTGPRPCALMHLVKSAKEAASEDTAKIRRPKGAATVCIFIDWRQASRHSFENPVPLWWIVDYSQVMGWLARSRKGGR